MDIVERSLPEEKDIIYVFLLDKHNRLFLETHIIFFQRLHIKFLSSMPNFKNITGQRLIEFSNNRLFKGDNIFRFLYKSVGKGSNIYEVSCNNSYLHISFYFMENPRIKLLYSNPENKINDKFSMYLLGLSRTHLPGLLKKLNNVDINSFKIRNLNKNNVKMFIDTLNSVCKEESNN